MKIAAVLSIILIGSIAIPHVGQAAAPSVTQLVAGDSSTCALFSNQRVKCWGSGTYAQTGNETGEVVGSEPGEMGDNLEYLNLGKDVLVERLIGGDYSTCAITTLGKIKCWGYGGSGSLASGKSDDLGDSSGEMGDLLPFANLGSVEKVISADGGYTHFCAVFADHKVKCWGSNNYGELGLGNTKSFGDRPDTIGDSIPFVNLGTNAKPVKVSGGRYHSCALFDNGKIKCWGYNSRGELGLGDTNSRGMKSGEMGDNLPFVDLGKDQKAIEVSAAEYFTCALLVGGEIKCWGSGTGGSLGLGDTNARGDEPGEMGDNLPFVDLVDGLPAISISSMLRSTCAVFLNGTMKCWGGNFSGQLGIGDEADRGDAPGEMGDALDYVYLGRNAHVDHIVVGGNHSCAAVSTQAVFKGVKCWGYNTSAQLGLGHYQSVGGATGDMNALGFLNLGTK